MNFSQYKDFNDFCAKNNFTYREGIESLDQVLEKKISKIKTELQGG